jgi:ketosteroid isomerase-like protein
MPQARTCPSGKPVDSPREQSVTIARTQGLIRANGKAFNVPLAHAWKLRDGKAVSFRPFIESPAMQKCLE